MPPVGKGKVRNSYHIAVRDHFPLFPGRQCQRGSVHHEIRAQALHSGLKTDLGDAMT
jgi:hypothetical protein